MVVGPILWANSLILGILSGLPAANRASPLIEPHQFSLNGSFSNALHASAKIFFDFVQL